MSEADEYNAEIERMHNMTMSLSSTFAAADYMVQDIEQQAKLMQLSATRYHHGGIVAAGAAHIHKELERIQGLVGAMKVAIEAMRGKA